MIELFSQSEPMLTTLVNALFTAIAILGSCIGSMYWQQIKQTKELREKLEEKDQALIKILKKQAEDQE